MKTSAKSINQTMLFTLLCGCFINLQANKLTVRYTNLGVGRDITSVSVNSIKTDLLNLRKDTCGDLIIYLDGSEELVQIEEISSDMITYRACNYPAGPIRKTAIKNVFMIKYTNGQVEVLTKSEVASKSENKIEKNNDNYVPKIPEGVYAQNIDLIVTKKGEKINCYIDDVSISGISYHIFRRGVDPHNFIHLNEVARYVNKYKLTELNH